MHIAQVIDSSDKSSLFFFIFNPQTRIQYILRKRTLHMYERRVFRRKHQNVKIHERQESSKLKARERGDQNLFYQLCNKSKPMRHNLI